MNCPPLPQSYSDKLPVDLGYNSLNYSLQSNDSQRVDKASDLSMENWASMSYIAVSHVHQRVWVGFGVWSMGGLT